MNIQIWKAKITRLSGEVNSEANPLADNIVSSDADIRRMLLEPNAHDNPRKSGGGQLHSTTWRNYCAPMTGESGRPLALWPQLAVRQRMQSLEASHVVAYNFKRAIRI